jgi:hypothetical protein
MSRVTRWFIIVAAGVLCFPIRMAAQVAADPDAAKQAEEERQECVQNLKAIYQAVEVYQLEHKDLPNWLSDLVPKYIADPNLLVCPVCRRTGKTEGPPLADPKLPSSYLFEFCPVPLGNNAPTAPNRTRREWKRRQMGLVGSVVPIVRCRHHNPALNLAFDGRIYDSPPAWENGLTNRIDPAELSPAKRFANEPPSGKPTEKADAPLVRHYPVRDAKASKQLIDLTPFYNAMLTESWHGGTENHLREFPAGIQNLGGVDFDVRGIIQLGGKSEGAKRFPMLVKDIPVDQKCERIHFLHAAAFGVAPDEGKPMGAYVIHYAMNQMRLEIPLQYGREMRNWHTLKGETNAANTLTVVWTGENGISKKANASLRLYMTTWTNVAPSVPIKSIDLQSATNTVTPFLLGITVE